jgi:hypothetical protein
VKDRIYGRQIKRKGNEEHRKGKRGGCVKDMVHKVEAKKADIYRVVSESIQK